MQLWTVWEGALVGTGIEDGGVVLVRCAWSGDGAGAAHEDAVFSALSAEQLGGAAEELVSLEDVIDVSVGHAVPYLLLRIAAPAAGDSRFAVVALADSSGWAPRVMLTFSVHGRPVGKAAPAEPSSVPAWYSARLIDGPGTSPSSSGSPAAFVLCFVRSPPCPCWLDESTGPAPWCASTAAEVSPSLAVVADPACRDQKPALAQADLTSGCAPARRRRGAARLVPGRRAHDLQQPSRSVRPPPPIPPLFPPPPPPSFGFTSGSFPNLHRHQLNQARPPPFQEPRQPSPGQSPNTPLLLIYPGEAQWRPGGAQERQGEARGRCGCWALTVWAATSLRRWRSSR